MLTISYRVDSPGDNADRSPSCLEHQSGNKPCALLTIQRNRSHRSKNVKHQTLEMEKIEKRGRRDRCRGPTYLRGTVLHICFGQSEVKHEPDASSHSIPAQLMRKKQGEYLTVTRTVPSGCDRNRQKYAYPLPTPSVYELEMNDCNGNILATKLPSAQHHIVPIRQGYPRNTGNYSQQSIPARNPLCLGDGSTLKVSQAT